MREGKKGEREVRMEGRGSEEGRVRGGREGDIER